MMEQSILQKNVHLALIPGGRKSAPDRCGSVSSGFGRKRAQSSFVEDFSRSRRFVLWFDQEGEKKVEPMGPDDFVTSIRDLADRMDDIPLDAEQARHLVAASVAITHRLAKFYRSGEGSHE